MTSSVDDFLKNYGSALLHRTDLTGFTGKGAEGFLPVIPVCSSNRYRLYRLPVIPVTGYTGWENSACPRQTLYETVKLTVTADCMVMEPAYLTVA